MTPSHASPAPSLADWREHALLAESHVARVVLGQPRALRLLLISVFARGHALLQGDVGVGKTTILRAFAHVLGGTFARIEGSVDLMPNDLLYNTYIGADGRPAVEPGPLVRHGENLSVFFFNEINRARPQVHALMLRAMAERSCAAFGKEIRLPFLQVFADRNRLEREETFEISQAARDRFMFEVTIEPPSDAAERAALMLDPRFHDTDALIATLPAAVLDHRALPEVAAAIQRSVQASPTLERYTLALWQATATPAAFGVRLADEPDVDVDTLVLAGASPRGMGMLLRAARVAAWLDGRDHVTPEDLHAVFHEAIAHRLALQPVHELRRHELAPKLVQGILRAVPTP